jgi:hypothetical protein
MIAAEPLIVDAVTALNRSYSGMSDDAIAARIERIDANWNTPAGDPMVKEMLATRASSMLLRRHDLDPRLLRITVTDARGATAAASHKTLDYYQADEEYWQNIYAEGRGAVSVTDVLYDKATGANYIGIGVPVVEEGSSRLIGTADALVDISSLFPIVNRAQMGPNSRTMLLKDDGTIIVATHASLAMNVKSDEYESLREALGTNPSQESGYLVADVRAQGKSVIGFADTGLKRDYGKLGWTVLVSQNSGDAFASVRVIQRLLAFMSLIGIATVTILAAWFALHRKRPFAEIGELRPPPAPGTHAETDAAHHGEAGRRVNAVRD